MPYTAPSRLPGKPRLNCPLGRVKLSYQESVYATQSGVIEFWVPDDLEMLGPLDRPGHSARA